MSTKKIIRLCAVLVLFTFSWSLQVQAKLAPGNSKDTVVVRPPQIRLEAPSKLQVRSFPDTLPVDLEWKDNSINETGFIIERSTNGGSYSVVGTVQPGVTSFTDHTVTKDMKVRYRVSANGSSGKSAYSNEVDWITLPNTPSNLTAHLNNTLGAVRLDWQGNNVYASYKITKTTIAGNKTMIESIAVQNGAFHYYEDKNIAAGNTYTYIVVAVSPAGRSGISNKVTVAYPAAPGNVSVSYFPGASTVTVKWQDNSSSEEKFRIEKAHSNQGGIIVSEVGANTTQFEDEVRVDYLHMYRIAAVSADGTLSPYSKVYYWYAPPQYPDGVKAVALSGSEVKLTWNDRSAHETSFKMTRKGDNMVVPIEVAANTTMYTDKGLTANTTYRYTICAYNSTSNTYSEYYPEVSVTTLK